MIQIQNLVKNYGDVRAVDHINFEVRDNEILGFLGPNGAGKSTTLRILTGYLSPTQGNIQVGNLNILDNSREIRQLCGYLPESNPLYTDMIVYDYLKFIAEARNIKPEDFEKTLRRVVAKCGLDGVVNRQIRTLSKGYRQRVGLAQAIIHDPKILILDEPTTGLDPNQILEIRSLIKELGKNKTLIISSHILQEVQAVCDRIVIINKGRIVADGSTEELKASFQGQTKLMLTLKADENEISEITEAIPGIQTFKYTTDDDGIHHVTLEYPSGEDRRESIYNFIKTRNWALLEMYRELASLEDVFRNLTVEEEGVAQARQTKKEEVEG